VVTLVPTPLPTPEETDLEPPTAEEARFVARAVITAIAPASGPTPLQLVLVEAMFDALTGTRVDLHADPVGAADLAVRLARRNEAYRTRVLQVMILGALVLRPLPEDVAQRLDVVADELMVGDGMLRIAREYAANALGIAAVDFDRNGYTAGWDPATRQSLHTTTPLDEAWASAGDDVGLAERWRGLEALPAGTLGRRLTEFYRARGFAYPGSPGSAPPLLAQHDWVHVVADYGTTVESELEVFAFIARANDDPRAFSLLAMVVSLFETGALANAAGLFEAFPGQLSRSGVAVRVADAMRRGALVAGSVDFMDVDWFEVASLPVDEVRERFGVQAKSEAAVSAGAVGPWERGGISEYQRAAGESSAIERGEAYDSFGASVANDPGE